MDYFERQAADLCAAEDRRMGAIIGHYIDECPYTEGEEDGYEEEDGEDFVAYL